MGKVIRQNGYALMNIATTVESKQQEFKQLYESMYDQLDRNLGNEKETEKIWYGPRAEGCLTAAKNQKSTYEELAKEIEKLAEKIRSDARSWGTQQTNTY